MTRLLIVDDKEQDRYLLKTLLEKSGYLVDAAGDGVQALSIARAEPPDMIVSDVLMPVMDGFSLCRECRRDERFRQVPFIFYTATYTDPRDEDFALNLGADKFIVKPVEPSVLLQMIQETLSSRPQRKAAASGSSAQDDAKFFKNYSEALVRKLEDKLELFHTIFDIDTSVIFMLSPSHTVLELNRAAQKLFSAPGENVFDSGFVDLFVPEAGRKVFTEQLNSALSGSPIHDFESAMRIAGDSERIFLWNAQRLTRSSGVVEGVLLIGNDITERLQAERQRTVLETQLRQAQKMEALGTFAGGIAHDFNNILTGIIGFVDLTRETVSPGSVEEERLKNALIAANRAKELVGQILLVSRGGEAAFKPIEIAPLIKEAGKLLRASIPSSIDLRFTIDADCGIVLCEPTQIHQVLMNLCTNAYHAIGNANGAITISCTILRNEVKTYGSDPALIPATHIVIEVADTGTGMSPATMARMFDPYFTTKEKGKGTGLGLPVVKAIVHAHGGKILAQSAVGKGSTFRVYLPKKELHASAQPAIGSGAWEIGGNQSVLLVEDDEINGPMMAEALTALRYRVKLVSNGMEAQALFVQNPDCCDILMTDLTMPKMGGLELMKNVRMTRPGLPVVLMSGSLEVVPESVAESSGAVVFLKKPFSIGELSRVLKSIGNRNA